MDDVKKAKAIIGLNTEFILDKILEYSSRENGSDDYLATLLDSNLPKILSKDSYIESKSSKKDFEQSGFLRAISYNLFNVTNTAYNATKGISDVGRIGLAARNISTSSKEKSLRDAIVDEGGVFELIADESKPSRIPKVLNIIQAINNRNSYLYGSEKKAIERLKELDKEIKEIDDPINELENKSRYYAKKNTNGEYSEILIKLDERKIELKEASRVKKEKKEKEKLTLLSKLGNLSGALYDYHGLLVYLNNEDLVRSILTKPNYKFELSHNEHKPKEEDKIHISLDKNGRIILISKLGKKQISVNSQDVSSELYIALHNSISSNRALELSDRDKEELQNFIKLNNFPGVNHQAYFKLMSFLNLPNSVSVFDPIVCEKRKLMVDAFVELATQKHVKDNLVNLADENLVDNIFSLPQITPAVKEYHKLVSDLAEIGKEKEFRKLLGTILSQDPQFQNYISDLMDFIGSPDIIDPQDKKSVEYIEAEKRFDKSMLSLVDLVNVDVILAAIPLVDENLISNVLELPKVKETLTSSENIQKLDKIAKEAKEKLGEIAQNNEIMSLLENEQQNSSKVIDEIELLTKKEEQNKGASDFKKEIMHKENHVLKKILQTIRKLSESKDSCVKISDTLDKNKERIGNAIEKIIENDCAGKILRDFCLTGKEVGEFLPKICNENGLKAVADYVEKPTTIRLIMIFAKTKTLGFAVRKYSESLIKYVANTFSISKETKHHSSFSKREKERRLLTNKVQTRG